MEPKKKVAKRPFDHFFKFILLLSPTLILLAYITLPALKTLAGIAVFSMSPTEIYVDHNSPHKTGRKLQRFFRKYDTEVQLDDIINADFLRKENSLNYPLRGCLENSHTLFLPLKFRLPYYGVKVFEWCLILKK